MKVVETLEAARRAYLAHPGGLRDVELAELLQVNRMTAWRYRRSLNTRETDEHGVYVYVPTDADIALAQSIIAQQILIPDE